MAQATIAIGPIAIGFAPPLEVDLFSLTKTSVATGRAGCVILSVNRRYRFTRSGRGFALTCAVESMTDDAPPELSGRLRANLAPLLGVSLGFLLTEQGTLFALSDETQAMLAMQASMTTTVADASPSPFLQSIAAMTPDQQRGLLFNEARDLVRFAGQVMPDAVRDGDMVLVQEQPESEHALRLFARVHAISGISWRVERTFDAAQMPRHGVIATRMELLP